MDLLFSTVTQWHINDIIAELYVALLLGQKCKEFVSTVLQRAASTGLFIVWVLDVSEMCGLCVLLPSVL